MQGLFKKNPGGPWVLRDWVSKVHKKSFEAWMASPRRRCLLSTLVDPPWTTALNNSGLIWEGPGRKRRHREERRRARFLPLSSNLEAQAKCWNRQSLMLSPSFFVPLLRSQGVHCLLLSPAPLGWLLTQPGATSSPSSWAPLPPTPSPDPFTAPRGCYFCRCWEASCLFYLTREWADTL